MGKRLLWMLIVISLQPCAAQAQSMLDEGLHELETLRLRQLQTVQHGAEISLFTSDGCSGNLSSSWNWFADRLPQFEAEFGRQPPWEHCCIAHDRVYWRGNVVDGHARRAQADAALRQCVLAVGDARAAEFAAKLSLSEARVRQNFRRIADLMHRAVRFGGQPCSLLPWRWGYGWPNCAFAAPTMISNEYSDIEADETVVFFDTAAWLDSEQTHWHIPLHAWIYEPADSKLRLDAFASLLDSSYGLEITPSEEHNFRRRTNLILADSERGKRLIVRIAGRDFELPQTRENGQVYAELKLTVETVDAFADGEGLDYFAITRRGETRRFEGVVQLVAPRGMSVISDIDDTIKITNVRTRRQLLQSTFYDDFTAAEGMPALYRHLAASGADFHFVSSSPWQLYSPLREFILAAGFPRAAFSLKVFRFRDQTLLNLFKPGSTTKPAQIEPLLLRYPERKFILIGDSGEQDPEVYGSIARRYPSQVSAILIRNVDASRADDSRYQLAFAAVGRDKWQLFTHPVQLDLERIGGR